MRWKGPPCPTVPRSERSAHESAEPATIARQNLGELRSTRCPSPRAAPSGGGSPVRWTRRELRSPGARSRELPVLMLADPEVSPGAAVTVSGGVRDFYRRRKTCARGRSELSQDSLRTPGSSTEAATLPPVRGALSTGYPPVHPLAGDGVVPPTVEAHETTVDVSPPKPSRRGPQRGCHPRLRTGQSIKLV
jgi:hypothetical protein